MAALTQDAGRPPPLPRFAQIEPVGRCNLACRMCPVHERGDVAGTLSLADFERLLDQMPGLERLHLQGLGEPMLHPQFFDMVALATARGIDVSANSNLTLLTPARARACVASGLRALSVSLDGATAATFEAIRRRASFDKVLRNLDRLVAAREAAGSPLAIRGVMVLMRDNLDELPALVALLQAHGVHELLVQRLSNELDAGQAPAGWTPIRRYVEQAELRDADLARAESVFDAARRQAQALGVVLHLPRLAPPPAAPTGCRWPWEQLYVTAAGELLPCCMVATAERVSFGNVLGEQGGLSARWQGEAAQAFRGALAGEAPPAVCRGCALYRGTF